jgi:hypothetical protein
MERINAGLLIPGRGEPVRDATIVIDGTRISYAGPAAAAPETPGAVTRDAATVMPGMWDCHGHFVGSRAMDLARLPQEPVAIERGVTIAMGTDLGLTGLDLPGAWGTNGTELGYMVALGMTPGQAIEAATATPPRTLGPQAPRRPIFPCSRTRSGSPPSGPADARSKAISDRPLAVRRKRTYWSRCSPDAPDERAAPFSRQRNPATAAGSSRAAHPPDQADKLRYRSRLSHCPPLTVGAADHHSPRIATSRSRRLASRR